MIMNMKDIMTVPDVKVHHPQPIHLYMVSSTSWMKENWCIKWVESDILFDSISNLEYKRTNVERLSQTFYIIWYQLFLLYSL